jgi:hypothetical protein
MNEMIKTPIADEEVFAALRPKSLGDIRRQCETSLTEPPCATRGRPSGSSSRSWASISMPGAGDGCQRFGPCLSGFHPALADVSPKRLENIKSLIRKAVERFGSRRV